MNLCSRKFSFTIIRVSIKLDLNDRDISAIGSCLYARPPSSLSLFLPGRDGTRDRKLVRFPRQLVLCSPADGISVSRSAGSRNDARLAESGQFLHRYTHLKRESQSGAICIYCTKRSNVNDHVVINASACADSQTHRIYAYIFFSLRRTFIYSVLQDCNHLSKNSSIYALLIIDR